MTTPIYRTGKAKIWTAKPKISGRPKSSINKVGTLGSSLHHVLTRCWEHRGEIREGWASNNRIEPNHSFTAYRLLQTPGITERYSQLIEVLGQARNWGGAARFLSSLMGFTAWQTRIKVRLRAPVRSLVQFFDIILANLSYFLLNHKPKIEIG